MSKIFEKYNKRGAYHWEMISRNLNTHRPFTVARYKICLEMLGDVRGKMIVDFGCGDGALAGLIAKAGGVIIGFDSNETGLSLAKDKFNKYGLSGTFHSKLSMLSNELYDAVVCSDVIEHVDNPEEIMKEIFRILKPGGNAVISTPIRLAEEPWDKEHIREYFPSEFNNLCAKYGSIVEIKQAIPIAAQDLLYYKEGIIGRILNLILRIRSAWMNSNYLLNWKGLNRYFVLQIAIVKKNRYDHK